MILLIPIEDVEEVAVKGLEHYLAEVFGQTTRVGDGVPLPRDKDLFLERSDKEAVHDLGHTYGGF